MSHQPHQLHQLHQLHQRTFRVYGSRKRLRGGRIPRLTRAMAYNAALETIERVAAALSDASLRATFLTSAHSSTSVEWSRYAPHYRTRCLVCQLRQHNRPCRRGKEPCPVHRPADAHVAQ